MWECDVGKFMKHWKKRLDRSCPRCGEYEDAPHIYTCHSMGVEDIWEKALTNLEGWFNTMHTDLDTQHIILEHLKSWRDGAELKVILSLI